MYVKSKLKIIYVNGLDQNSNINRFIYARHRELKAFIPKVQFDRFQEIFICLERDYAKISRRPRKVDDYVG
jgi:hypothetical protein